MYLVRCLNPANHHLARIKKADKDFAKKLDFKNSTKFPVKVRNIHKIEKKKNFIALVFLVIKIRKNIQIINQKNVVKKNMLIYY